MDSLHSPQATPTFAERVEPIRTKLALAKALQDYILCRLPDEYAGPAADLNAAVLACMASVDAELERRLGVAADGDGEGAEL